MGAWPPRSLAGMFDLSRESGQKAQADPDLGWQEGYSGGSSILHHKWQKRLHAVVGHFLFSLNTASASFLVRPVDPPCVCPLPPVVQCLPQYLSATPRALGGHLGYFISLKCVVCLLFSFPSQVENTWVVSC